MDENFTLPTDCTSTFGIRCSVELLFWYDRRNFTITWRSETLTKEEYSNEERHFLMIETAERPFFSYNIEYKCREADHCTSIFVRKIIPKMIQHSFNLTAIFVRLKKLLYDKQFLNNHLACFTMQEEIRQCSIPGTIGHCQMVDDLIKSKLYRSNCERGVRPSASVNIYDSGHFAVITIKCNRMLCNGPLTITAVKKLLRYHNITNEHDRLSAGNLSKWLSSTVFILTVFLLFTINASIT